MQHTWEAFNMANQVAASEVPRLNDDKAASAATSEEEQAVSHLDPMAVQQQTAKNN